MSKTPPVSGSETSEAHDAYALGEAAFDSGDLRSAWEHFSLADMLVPGTPAVQQSLRLVGDRLYGQVPGPGTDTTRFYPTNLPATQQGAMPPPYEDMSREEMAQSILDTNGPPAHTPSRQPEPPLGAPIHDLLTGGGGNADAPPPPAQPPTDETPPGNRLGMAAYDRPEMMVYGPRGPIYISQRQRDSFEAEGYRFVTSGDRVNMIPPAGGGSGSGGPGATLGIDHEVQPVDPEEYDRMRAAQDQRAYAAKLIADSENQVAERAAGVAVGLAERMEADADRSEQIRAQAQSLVEQDHAQLQADIQNVAQLQVDPDRFWHSRGTAAHVAGAIAMGLESFARSMNPNVPMLGTQLITDAIDRDLRAQAANISFAREGARLRMGLLESQMQNYGNLQDALAASQAIMLAATTKRLAAVSQQSRADAGGAWLTQASATLQEAQARANLAFQAGRESFHIRAALKTTPQVALRAATTGAAALGSPAPAGVPPEVPAGVPPMAPPPVSAQPTPGEEPRPGRRGSVHLAPEDAPVGRPPGLPAFTAAQADRAAEILGEGVTTLPSGWRIDRTHQTGLSGEARTEHDRRLTAYTNAVNIFRQFENRLNETYGDDRAMANVWQSWTDRWRVGHGDLYVAIGNISDLMGFRTPQEHEMEIIVDDIFPSDWHPFQYRETLHRRINQFTEALRDWGAMKGIEITPIESTNRQNAETVRGN